MIGMNEHYTDYYTGFLAYVDTVPKLYRKYDSVD